MSDPFQITDPSAKVRLTTIEVRAPDSEDGQIWLQSSIAETHRLPRGCKEQFTFGRTDLVILTNRGGGKATLRLRSVTLAESGIVLGSTRRGTRLLRQDMAVRILLEPGEVITLRSYDAVEPRTGAPIRPGHITARA